MTLTNQLEEGVESGDFGKMYPEYSWTKETAEAGTSGGHPQLERLAGRSQAPPAHVVGERGHRELLGDLGLADERAGPTPPDDVALPREIIESRSKRQSRYPELGAELPF